MTKYHLMMDRPAPKPVDTKTTHAETAPQPPAAAQGKPVVETGGPSGPEPTRYGDWEHKGRCIDF